MNNKNRGFSILVIVLIVALVLTISLVGAGVYAYTTNPYVVLSDSYTKTMDITKTKNFSAKGTVSMETNIGELVKNSQGYKELDSKKEVDGLINIFGKNGKYSLEANSKVDNENLVYLINTNMKVTGIDFGNYKDIVSSDGNLLDLDYLVKLNSSKNIDKFLVKINKTMNYFPFPNNGGGIAKVSLSPLTNSWVEFPASMFAPAATNSNTNSTSEKTTTVSSTRNILSCEKKEVSMIDKALAGLAIMNSGIDAKNLGTVELEGKKVTKIIMNLKVENKGTLIDAFDRASKIICKDGEKLENDRLVNYFFLDLAMREILVTTYISKDNGLIAKQEVEVNFDKNKIGSDLSAKSELSIYDVNETTVSVPNSSKSFQKFAEENLAPIVNQVAGVAVNSIQKAPTSQSSAGGSYACNVPQKEIDNFMRVCMSSEQFQDITNDIKGLCGCMVTQQRNVACNDSAGFDRKVNQNCSKYVR